MSCYTIQLLRFSEVDTCFFSKIYLVELHCPPRALGCMPINGL